MLVIPTWVAENSYIPSPQMVCHSIFGLVILEDWQVDLHPQTSSCLSCSVTLSGPPHHGWLMGTPFAYPIRTTCPWRGRSTRGVSWQLWGALSSTLSSISTCTLRMSIPLLSPVITCISPFHLYFRSIFLQAFHPLFDVVCWCGGLVCLYCSMEPSWPLALVLFYTTVSAMAEQPSWTVLTVISIWAPLLAQLTGLAKWNPTSLSSPRDSPPFEQSSFKN